MANGNFAVWFIARTPRRWHRSAGGLDELPGHNQNHALPHDLPHALPHPLPHNLP